MKNTLLGNHPRSLTARTILGAEVFASIAGEGNAESVTTVFSEAAVRIRRTQITKNVRRVFFAMPPTIYPMLDPLAPVHRPWRFHLRDRVVFDVDVNNSGVPPLGAWGLWNLLNTADPDTIVGIGFYVRGNNDQWVAFIRDSADDVNIRNVFVQPTGITAQEVIRALRLVIDGQLNTVTWFVDDSEVATYDFRATGVRLEKMGPIEPALTWGIWTDGTVSPAQDVSLYMTVGGSYEMFVFEIIEAGGTGVEAPPSTPTISVQQLGGTFVDLAGSTYTHPSGRPHRMSGWQVDEVDGDFSTPVVAFASETQLRAARAVGLQPNTNYQARVRYFDSLLNASAWSETVTFTTLTSDPATAWSACD